MIFEKLFKKQEVITEIIEVGSAQKVVENVLKRGIKYYNPVNLTPPKRKQYYNDAQAALRNETIKNEANHIVADLVEHMAKKAKDFDEVQDLRMTINGIELLRERLESVQDPDTEVSKEDIHSAV